MAAYTASERGDYSVLQELLRLFEQPYAEQVGRCTAATERGSQSRRLGSTLSRMQLHHTDAYYRGRPDEAATQGGVGEAARRLTPVNVCYGT